MNKNHYKLLLAILSLNSNYTFAVSHNYLQQETNINANNILRQDYHLHTKLMDNYRDRTSLLINSAKDCGYAAGDLDLAKNFWVKGFTDLAKQKEYNNQAGYNSSNVGITIAGEQMLGNKTWLGVGASYTKANIKTRIPNPSYNDIYSHYELAR